MREDWIGTPHRWLREIATVLSAAATVGLIVPPAVGATQVSSVLVGVVESAESRLPLPNVQVRLDDSGTLTLTDSTGAFRLVVAPGEQSMSFWRPGFVPRRFHMNVGAAPDELDIGVVDLTPAETRIARLSGVVMDRESERPLPTAILTLNGSVIGITDEEGQFGFATDDAVSGFNQISVKRIGYAALTHDFWLADEDGGIELSFQIEKLPYRLEEIVVSADRTIYVRGALADFYRRRKMGIGSFLTEDEIEESYALETTDLLRRMPGVRILYDPNSFNRIISFGRSGGFSCSGAAIYLDGAPISQDLGIDRIAYPEMLAGIEVYSGPSRIPIQYNATGSACGVVLLWTK